MESCGSSSSITSLESLPEGCVSEILGLTSPRDACRFSVVSKSFRSTADSDPVWIKFLPSDYQTIIDGSVNPIPEFSSKKELYVYLCHNSILIDGGRKSFSLEKWTGKKCYILGARGLRITWSETPEYWGWTSAPESRFPEVAKLKLVWWLEICGTISAGMLSPHTSYAAYFVYKLKDEYGFDYRPSEVSVGISGLESEKRYAFLDPEGEWQDDDDDDDDDDDSDDGDEEAPSAPDDHDEDAPLPEPEQGSPSLAQSNIQLPKLRNDGWSEVELGEFVSENEDDRIEMFLKEVKCGFPKRGLIIEGIELRPRIG